MSTKRIEWTFLITCGHVFIDERACKKTIAEKDRIDVLSKTKMTEFETGHADSINDLQIDYYGRRVATASSDTTIRIFDLSSSPPTFLADLRGHRGPVWKVAWAHPKFGSVLASCSFDSTVIVWSETESGWIQVHKHFLAKLFCRLGFPKLTIGSYGISKWRGLGFA